MAPKKQEDGPVFDPEILWYRHSNGNEFGAYPGTELHKRALAESEIWRIDGPEGKLMLDESGPAAAPAVEEEEEVEPEAEEAPSEEAE